MLIDSKILLIDKSRISLLNDLTRLSVFDNRTYLLELLKNFLLVGIKLKLNTEWFHFPFALFLIFYYVYYNI